MTAFRKIIVSVLAVALLAGGSAIAFGGVVAVPDCPALSSAGGNDGCGGNGGMSGYDIACAMSFAAAIGKEENAAVPEFSGAPLERRPANHGLIARPPDTAPPKAFFA